MLAVISAISEDVPTIAYHRPFMLPSKEYKKTVSSSAAEPGAIPEGPMCTCKKPDPPRGSSA